MLVELGKWGPPSRSCSWIGGTATATARVEAGGRVGESWPPSALLAPATASR